jgi:hypothetical protein
MRKAPIRAITAKLILPPYPWSIVSSEQTLYNGAAATVVKIITLGFATAMAYRYHVASLAKATTDMHHTKSFDAIDATALRVHGGRGRHNGSNQLVWCTNLPVLSADRPD